MTSHSEYKQEILDNLKLAVTTIALSPNYRTMAMISDKLVDRGLDRQLANEVVTSMQINVTTEIFDDVEFMNQMVDGFAEVVMSIHKVACLTFQSDVCFKNLVAGMSLTLTP